MQWISRLNHHTGRLDVHGTPVELLHFAYQRHLPDNVPHRHTYFEICLVGGHGAGHFVVEDRPYPLGPGDLFIARPGVIHQIRNCGRPEMELFWFSFGWPASEKARGGTGPAESAVLLEALAAGSVLVVPDPGQVRGLWQALRSLAEYPEVPGKDAQLRSLAGTLILAAAQLGAGAALGTRESPPGPDENLAARLAVRYIHDNLGRDLGVRELAAQAAVSPRHLARIFRRFAGVSPMEYLETARLRQAQHLLRHTDRSIKEIAAAVGYADAQYFSRVFSRRLGMSPRQWRRSGSAAGHVSRQGQLV